MDNKNEFDGVKVFSASKHEDRNRLGEDVTRWLNNPELDNITVVDKVVTQSSDEAFHCVTITIFYRKGA